MPTKIATIDERLSPLGEDVVEALVKLARAGHATRCISDRVIAFDNGFTQPDDIIRFIQHLPALRRFTLRLPIEQS